MTSHEKKRMDDLERRVRELEARPVAPTVVVVQPYTPPPPPVYPWPWVQPFIGPNVVGPTIIYGDGLPGTFTCSGVIS